MAKGGTSARICAAATGWVRVAEVAESSGGWVRYFGFGGRQFGRQKTFMRFFSLPLASNFSLFYYTFFN
jgi:hypothetical protein